MNNHKHKNLVRLDLAFQSFDLFPKVLIFNMKANFLPRDVIILLGERFLLAILTMLTTYKVIFIKILWAWASWTTEVWA